MVLKVNKGKYVQGLVVFFPENLAFLCEIALVCGFLDKNLPNNTANNDFLQVQCLQRLCVFFIGFLFVFFPRN